MGRAAALCLIGGLAIVSCMAPLDLKHAEDLAAVGDWDGALVAYQEFHKREPFNPVVKQRLEEMKARAAEFHYGEGKSHLKASRLADAFREFKTALTLEPTRLEYHAALADALRVKEAGEHVHTAQKLEGLGRTEEALESYQKAVELQPELTHVLDSITRLTEHGRGQRTLGGVSNPITLRFQNAKLKEVFEVLARAGNINVVFDREVKDDPVTIFIKDAPFHEALNLILSTNNLFAKRIGPDTLLVIPNTKQKLDQYQDLAIRTFYLSNAKAKDMVNLLKTMLDSKRMYVNEQINSIVLRDYPEKIRLAERIILANDRRESEVEFDLEVLELTRTKKEQLGIDFAKTAAAGVVPPGFTGSLSTAAQQFNLSQLTALGPQSYLMSIPTTVLANFFQQHSDAKTLASPKLRVVNGKQASVNVGDKQPILLSTTNVLPGQAATGAIPTTSTVTSIEFKDTGVKVTVEPTIHLTNELTLKMKIEVTKIGDLITLQSNPLIQQFRFGTRMAETTLNMKDGESVVLAGLIQDEDRKTRVSVPGLGDIPVLGTIFSSNTVEAVTTEVVLTITPHIVRNLHTPTVESQTFWSGTEQNYSTTPLFTDLLHRQPVSSQTAPVPHPTSLPVPSVPVSAAPPAKGSTEGSAVRGPETPDAVPTKATTGEAGRHLAMQPVQVTAFTGQEVRIDVTAKDMEVAQSSITIAYNPQILEFRRASEGDLLKQAAGTGGLTVAVNPSSGQLVLSMRRDGPPALGPGILASLVFQAKGPGTSPIDIMAATLGEAKVDVGRSAGGATVRVQ